MKGSADSDSGVECSLLLSRALERDLDYRIYRFMLKEHINEIRSKWNPKERRGSGYDPSIYVETPEQARKLLNHLKQKLRDAQKNRDHYLASEISQSLEKVESIARRFFRWEESLSKTLQDQDLREIKNLPIRF